MTIGLGVIILLGILVDKLEAIKAITKYIDELVNDSFTGDLTIHFIKGVVSNKVQIRQSEKL